MSPTCWAASAKSRATALPSARVPAILPTAFWPQTSGMKGAAVVVVTGVSAMVVLCLSSRRPYGLAGVGGETTATRRYWPRWCFCQALIFASSSAFRFGSRV